MRFILSALTACPLSLCRRSGTRLRAEPEPDGRDGTPSLPSIDCAQPAIEGLVAMGEKAVERIYELKGRPLSKPCVTVVNATIFDDVVLPIDATVRAWIDDVARRTPLAVVARLAPTSRLLSSMPAGVRAQATQEGTIATFHAAGRIVEAVAALAQADGKLILGSSANAAGTGNNAAFDDVPASMRRGADLSLDRGPAWYSNEHRHATTILDLSTGSFLRQGINFAKIERSWSALLRAA